MKTCSECKITKPLFEFHKNKRRHDGYHEYCKACRKVQYYRRDRESAISRSASRYANNKEDCLSKMAERYQKIREQKQAYGRNHYANNKYKYKARSAQRKADVRRATPNWFSDDDAWMIREAYELAQLRKEATGIDWDVDHVIPLRGKIVCGLHVPTNIAVIPRKLNNYKRAKYVVE